MNDNRKNFRYWMYNLPLQISPSYETDPEDPDSYLLDDKGKKIISGYSVLNYMPRKSSCIEVDLEELIGDMSREEFLEYSAQHLENLARLMRKGIHEPDTTIYYHDDEFILDEEKLARNIRKPE